MGEWKQTAFQHLLLYLAGCCGQHGGGQGSCLHMDRELAACRGNMALSAASRVNKGIILRALLITPPAAGQNVSKSRNSLIACLVTYGFIRVLDEDGSHTRFSQTGTPLRPLNHIRAQSPRPISLSGCWRLTRARPGGWVILSRLTCRDSAARRAEPFTRLR